LIIPFYQKICSVEIRIHIRLLETAFSTLLIIHLILHWMYFLNIRKCLKPGSKESDACE